MRSTKVLHAYIERHMNTVGNNHAGEDDVCSKGHALCVKFVLCHVRAGSLLGTTEALSTPNQGEEILGQLS